MRNYLFYRFLVFSVLLVSSLTFATPRIIIKNATLIDAVNPVRDIMTVVLQGDVIQSIEESGSVTIDTQNDTIVNARGKYIIPGLWDAHVHLTFIPELDYKTSYDLFLANGITSIRDTGAVLDK